MGRTDYTDYNEIEEFTMVETLLARQNKNMNGLLSMSWNDFFRALVIAIIVAVGSYVLGVGDVWALDWHTLTNSAVLAGVASILTSLGTTNEGKLAGVIPVE